MARKRLGDLLVESGLISEEQLNSTLRRKSADEKLGDALLREGYITEQQLIEVLEFQLGIPHINIFQYPIDPDVIQLVPKELAKRHYAMPIRRDKNKLLVAMADPMDYFAIEELRMATGYHIEPAIATKDELFRTITKYYDLQESMEEVMGEIATSETLDETRVADDDSPVVRLVNQIIDNALVQRASDIHFDPQETELRVRYRVDGILRQDPDIVMIGEIRDTETAEVATRASLTGHLVLSTLHTNSSIEALSRLVDMGIEPFLISSSILGVVAQRLVRRVCRDCGQTVPATEREQQIFSSRGLTIETVRRGRGCPSCNMTGYRGRMAIHEVLPIDETIRHLILKTASTTEIRDYVRKKGMEFLIDDGLKKVKEGVTTTEEILRVAVLE